VPLPAGSSMVVSENGRLEFSKDGAHLYFGTAPAPRVESVDAPEPVKVDIWNYKDAELQPMQKVPPTRRRNGTTARCSTWPTSASCSWPTPILPDVRIGDSAERAVGVSNVPYRQLVSWDGNYDDYYMVKLADGARQKILSKEKFGATLSPGGSYVLFFDDDDDNWYTVARERRREVEPHEESRREVPERDARFALASQSLWAGRLDRRRQVGAVCTTATTSGK